MQSHVNGDELVLHHRILDHRAVALLQEQLHLRHLGLNHQEVFVVERYY